MNRHADDAIHLDPSYCGECYGAPAPSTASKAGCCNTCAEVREAYASVSWSFGRGENVEQCQREHYAENLDVQRKEGCRIEGGIRVNKVIGNFHFAPGKSFSNGNMHVHDLDNYLHSPEEHTFGHVVHQLRFGPALPETLARQLERKKQGGTVWSKHYLNPLDGAEQITTERNFNYMYFLKIVSTAYLPLGWASAPATDPSTSTQQSHDLVRLGDLGLGQTTGGSIETHQYSVTSHKRNLAGGTDLDHKERRHISGGFLGCSSAM